MQPTLTASAIVRSRDKAATIERTMLALRRQSVPLEIVVVDSGSTDATLDIARRHADVVVEISPSDFTYGGALNRGSQAASGDIHFPVSAHTVPPSTTWVEDSLRHYDDERVAGTNGAMAGPDGRPLAGAYRPTLDEAMSNAGWGFSNHAGSWRSTVVSRHRFRSDLEACEDKEWYWRVLRAGFEVVFDPALCVPSTHRRQLGLRALWWRSLREARALTELGHAPVGTYHELAHELLDFSQPSRWPAGLRFFSPYRWAEQSGRYLGSRPRQQRTPTVAPAHVTPAARATWRRSVELDMLDETAAR